MNDAGPQADRVIVPEATVEDLDPALLGQLLEARRGSRALAGVHDPHIQLTRLNVTDRDGAVRLAALLSLGTYPQQFVPRLTVDVLDCTHGEGQPPQARTCEGPITTMVFQAAHAITEILARTDARPLLPESALREVVTNALVHRDYRLPALGRPVTVKVSRHRVEVNNPCYPWTSLALDGTADHRSWAHNPTLFQLLAALGDPSGGETVVSGRGMGMPVVTRAMLSRGFSRPVATMTNSADLTISLDLTDPSPAMVMPAAMEVLGALSTTEPRSIAEIAEATGRAVSSLRHVMRELVAAGKVVATAPPQSRHRRYLRV